MSLNGLSSNGLITVPSNYSVRETLDRLEAALKAAGITIFARVDHAGGAAAVGLALRPTEVIIFGSPKGGTPLMQANQMAGLDLPLRVLAWEDEAGNCSLTYNDINWLAARYDLGAMTEPAREGLTKVLAKFTAKAAS
ncbi:MAG TPA: DUF302 domain-containing protein [Methylovirgula sp.]